MNKKSVIIFLVCFIIGYFGTQALTAANASGTYPLPPIEVEESTVTVRPSLLPPCDEEDGTVTSGGVEVPACAWDAQRDGNGTGTSFVVFRR